MSCWTEILNNINFYKNQFYDEKSRKIYFFTPNFSMSRIRLWDEYFFPFTQINLIISYDNFINRFHENFYFNIFGKMKQKNRIISNVQYITKEKENDEKFKDNLINEIRQLKNAISELTIKNNINKELFDGLSIDTKNVINNIAKEKGGEFNLNKELDIYIFKEIEKKSESKKEEIKLNEENKNIILEEKLENKIAFNIEKNEKEEPIKNEIKNKNNENTEAKNENKKENSINKNEIKNFFGLNQKPEIIPNNNDYNRKDVNKEKIKENEEYIDIQNQDEKRKIKDEIKEEKENIEKNEIKEDLEEKNNKEDIEHETIKTKEN